ncbi:MAG TPA: hypothetical protein VFJ16_08270 [Longimicrobium sp.]|nr:hypothetical protein [Longimicrobium sp.]
MGETEGETGWGDCRLCGSSFEFEDGVPAACRNPACRSNTEPDEMNRALDFAIAVGFLEVADQHEGRTGALADGEADRPSGVERLMSQTDTGAHEARSEDHPDPPARIFLQVPPDGDWTWCAEAVHGSDVEYVLRSQRQVTAEDVEWLEGQAAWHERVADDYARRAGGGEVETLRAGAADRRAHAARLRRIIAALRADANVRALDGVAPAFNRGATPQRRLEADGTPHTCATDALAERTCDCAMRWLSEDHIRAVLADAPPAVFTALRAPPASPVW